MSADDVNDAAEAEGWRAGPHGGDAEAVARRLGIEPGDLLDLSASLNPVAPDPRPLVARHLEAVIRYPDDHRAHYALAEALGVEPERVVLTNGGAEAIALVAQLHPSGWAEECEFSLYRRHLQHLDPSGPRWMSDPHNPTGCLAAPGERAFVRDEAFYPLATGRWTRGDADSIVVGSLTKVFACPGLRLGYVIAPDPASARRLADVRPRWSVSGPAAAVVPALLESADLGAWTVAVAVLRDQLRNLLASHAITAAPGAAANYLWLPRQRGLRRHLAEHRILIRSGASFGQPQAARIAVPNGGGLERLARALSTFEAGQ